MATKDPIQRILTSIPSPGRNYFLPCPGEICVSVDGKPIPPVHLADLSQVSVKRAKLELKQLPQLKTHPGSYSDLRLIHEDQFLDNDSAPLSQYLTKSKSQFDIQVESLTEICVRSFDGKLKLIHTHLDQMSVKQLKQRLELPGSSSDLSLIYKGLPLDDDSALLSQCLDKTKPRLDLQAVMKVHGG